MRYRIVDNLRRKTDLVRSSEATGHVLWYAEHLATEVHAREALAPGERATLATRAELDRLNGAPLIEGETVEEEADRETAPLRLTVAEWCKKKGMTMDEMVDAQECHEMEDRS